MVHLEKRFHAPPGRLFEALTDRREVIVSIQSPAVVVEPKDGGAYVLYDGAIQGNFVGAPTAEKLSLRWRMRQWEDGCYSNVEITLKPRGEDGDGCLLTLHHSGIPLEDRFGSGNQNQMVLGGWKKIFEGISRFLGLSCDNDDD